MPLPITCACGAQFDAEEALAGQATRCPECQQPVTVPAVDRLPRRTSLLALFSAILALVGAFTVVGTVLAAMLGLAGIIHVARNRDRVAGAGLATFGLVAGVVLTGLTIFALSTNELFGLGSPTHMGQLNDDVDATGPLEVRVTDKGFALTRPSAHWGRARLNAVSDPIASQLLDDPDLLLVHSARYLFVEARVADVDTNIDRCCEEVLAALQASHSAFPMSRLRNVRLTVRDTKELPAAGWAERRELLVDIRCGSQAWTMLLRLQKTAKGDVYVTRAYTQRRRFLAAEAELRQVLDSFRLLDGH
jgi:hypothetical protein